MPVKGLYLSSQTVKRRQQKKPLAMTIGAVLGLVSAYAPNSLAAVPLSNKQEVAQGQVRASNAGEVDSVEFLVHQLEYARLIGRDDLLESTLIRLEAIDPNTPYSDYYEALAALKVKKLDQAKSLLAKLIESDPNSEQVKRLQAIISLQGEHKDAYNQAQLMAKTGRLAEALDIYDDIFPDGMPTPDLELEYLNIESQIFARYDKVLKSLKNLYQRYPDVPRIELAYAKHLTQDEPENSEGIKLLSKLIADPAVGSEAAELLLNRLDQAYITDDVAKAYRILASYYPNNQKLQQANQDAAQRLVKEKELRKDPTYLAKLDGLELVEQEKYASARQKLLYALTTRPHDPDILGGLGMVYRNTDQPIEALKYFELGKKYDQNLLHTDRWNYLIKSSSYWVSLEYGDRALAKKQYTKAKAFYHKAEELFPDDPYTRIKLGDLAFAQANYKLAKAEYQNALKLDSQESSAVRGIVNVIEASEGQGAALAYIQSLSPFWQKELADRARGLNQDVLLKQLALARTSQDRAKVLSILDKLIEHPPESPWDKADIADAYIANNQAGKADNLMANWRKQDNSAQMKFAYGLYLSRRDRLNDAIFELSSIAPSQRTESMRNNLARLSFTAQQIELAKLVEENPAAAKAKLATLKKLYQDDLDAQLRFIDVEASLGMREQALADINALLAKRDQLSFEQNLSLGEALFDLEDAQGFARWKQGLTSPQIPSNDEAAALAMQSLYDRRDELFARDALARQDYQAAKDLLIPLSRRSNLEAIDANLALLEVNQALSQQDPNLLRENQRILDTLYQQNELLNSGQKTSLAAGYYALALEDKSKQKQNQARAAELVKALVDEKDASALDYRQGLGIAMQMRDEPLAETMAYQSLAKAKTEFATDDRDDGLPIGAPKTLHQALSSSTQSPSQAPQESLRDLYDTAANNWLTRSVKSDIDKINQARDGYVMIGMDYSGRDGENKSVTVPVEALIAMPEYHGHLLLRADYVSLDSGSLDYYSTDDSFDADFKQKVDGVALGIGWRAQDWSFDIGTTPVGFDKTEWVGGVNFAGDLGDFGWKVTASRRAETSSTLSYAGMVVPDNATVPGEFENSQDPEAEAIPKASDARGDYWGMVMTQGVKLGLSYDVGDPVGYWGSLQAHWLTGENVEDNTRFALLGGAYWKIINEENQRLSLGANSLMFFYDKNLSEYLYGSGGYYSPQQYYSVSLPVTYYARPTPWLSYYLSGSISNSWTKEDAPYGTNEDSSTGGGFGGSLEGAIEARLTKRWYIGASLDMQRSEDYAPNHYMMYLRYTFNDRWQPVAMPIEPLTLYADFE